MPKLFKRKSRLTIYRPLPDDFFGLNTASVTVIENLRVQFSIEKTADKRPNTAKIVVYNMNEESRNDVGIKGNHAILEIGYGANDELREVFSGDVYFAESVQENAEWMTTLEFGNGQRANGQIL